MKRVILALCIVASLAMANTVTIGGLQWQDDSDAKSVKRDFVGAKAYCEELSLSGSSDWRLPTIKELQSIVDIKKYKPAIKSVFKNTASGDYWSSTPHATRPDKAWDVNFEYGYTDYDWKKDKFFVRCVRDK